MPEAQVPVNQEMARRDAEFYSQREATGFELDFGVDGSGLFLKFLEADLIVYATGYGSMNGWLADLVSPEIADRVGKC